MTHFGSVSCLHNTGILAVLRQQISTLNYTVLSHTSTPSSHAHLPYRFMSLQSTAENALVATEARTFDEEMEYVKQISPTCYTIKKGCVPNMKVEGECVTVAYCTGREEGKEGLLPASHAQPLSQRCEHRT
jgi:hypothetical protein